MKKKVISFLMAAAMVCNLLGTGVAAYAVDAKTSEYAVEISADVNNKATVSAGDQLTYTVKVTGTLPGKLMGYNLKLSYDSSKLTLDEENSKNLLEGVKNFEYGAISAGGTQAILGSRNSNAAAADTTGKSEMVKLVFTVNSAEKSWEDTSVSIASNEAGSGLSVLGANNISVNLTGVTYPEAVTVNYACNHQDVEHNTTAVWDEKEKQWEAKTTCSACDEVLTTEISKKLYVVTFDANGGTNTDTKLKNNTMGVISGEKVAKPADPEKQGYTFAGWKTESSETAFDFDMMVSGTCTVKATWTANAITAKPNELSISGNYGETFTSIALGDITLQNDAAGTPTFILTGESALPGGVELNQDEKLLSGMIGEVGELSFALEATGVNGSKTVIPVNYTGTARKIDATEISVADIADQPGNGSAITPKVTVTESLESLKEHKTLEEGTDYTLGYANNTAVGTATVTITGMGNYQGSRTVNFKIIEKPWPKITLPAATNTNFTFGASAKEILAGLPKLDDVTPETADGVAVKPEGALSYTYKKAGGTDFFDAVPLNAGSYEAWVVFTSQDDNYATGRTGVKVEFAIAQAAMTDQEDSANTNVTLGDDFENLAYNGAEQQPTSMTVAVGENTLTTNDYELSYQNNKDAGTATVTITGKGNYQGSVSKTFPIEQKALTVASVAAENKTYDGTVAATGTVTLAGAVAGEEPEATATFTFADKSVGAGKTVTATEFQLTEAWKKNYSLTQPASSTTTAAEITALTATYTGAAPTTSKTFDNTAKAEVTAAVISNKIGADDVTLTATAVYVDGNGESTAHAGTHDIQVTFALQGGNSGNYAVPAPVRVSGTINQKKLTAQMVKLSETSFAYNESVQKPTVQVETTETMLTAEDIAVSYSDTQSTAAGSYTVYVGAAVNGNYTLNGADPIAMAYTITKVAYDTAKHPLTVPAPQKPAYDLNAAKTLADIPLKQEDPGVWSWKAPTTALAKGEQSYLAVFTPSNPSYTPVEQNAKVLALDMSNIRFTNLSVTLGSTAQDVVPSDPTNETNVHGKATVRYEVTSSALETCNTTVKDGNIHLEFLKAGIAVVGVSTFVDNTLMGYNEFLVNIKPAKESIDSEQDAKNMLDTAVAASQENISLLNGAQPIAKAVVDNTMKAVVQYPALKPDMAKMEVMQNLDALAKAAGYTNSLYKDVQPASGISLQSGAGALAAAIGSVKGVENTTVQYVYRDASPETAAQLAFTTATETKNEASTAESAPAAPRQVTLTNVPLDTARTYYLMGTNANGDSLGRVECGIPTTGNAAQTYAAGGATTYSASDSLCLNFWLVEDGTYQLFSAALPTGNSGGDSNGVVDSTTSTDGSGSGSQLTTEQLAAEEAAKEKADEEARLWLAIYYQIITSKEGTTVSVNANGLSYVPGYILGAASERNQALIFVHDGDTYRLSASVIKSLNSSLNWSWENLAAWIAKQTPVTQGVAAQAPGTVVEEAEAKPTTTPAPATPAPTAPAESQQTTPSANQADQPKSHSPWPIVGVAAGVLVLVGGAAFLLRRRTGSKSSHVYRGRR